MKLVNIIILLVLLLQLFSNVSSDRTEKIKDVSKLWGRPLGDEIWPWAPRPTKNSNSTFHCDRPIEISSSSRRRMFTNCTSPDQKYPAAHVTCLCTSNTSQQATLTCHAGKWYLDKPGTCGQHCLPGSIPSNVFCENIPGETLYNTELNCNCRNNCLSAPMWCGHRGIWQHYNREHHCNRKFGEETKDGVQIRVNANVVMMSCGESQHIHESKCENGKIADPMPQCLTAGTMDGMEFSNSTIIVIILAAFLIICITIIVVTMALWYNKTRGCCHSNEETFIEATEMSNRPMTTVNKYSPSPHVRRLNDIKNELKSQINKPKFNSSFKSLGDPDVKQSDNPENKFVFKGKQLGVRYKKFDNENKNEAQNFEIPLNKNFEQSEYQNFDNSKQFEQAEYKNFGFENDEAASPEYQNFEAPEYANFTADDEYQNTSDLGYGQEEEELNTQEYMNAAQIFTISKGNVYDKPSTSSDYDRPIPSKDPYRYDVPKSMRVQETQREDVESNIYDDPDFATYDDVIPNRKRY